MNLKELVSHIAKKEGGKSNVKVGDIREIVGILSDLMYADYPAAEMLIKALYQNGKKRSKKKGKK